MATVLKSLHFLILLCVFNFTLALAQENDFICNGFNQANLLLNGMAKIHRNGLLQLTNDSRQGVGRAFYHFPIKFNTASSSLTSALSFSTNFVFALIPQVQSFGGHGIAFTISPSKDFGHAPANRYLGLFNSSNNGLSSNHVLAIELDTVQDPEFEDINGNHVGIDLNGLKSIESASATYFSDKEGKNISLQLTSGQPMHLWVDYDQAEKLLNITLASTRVPKPNRPLLSTTIDLSEILFETMFVGFSSTTGTLASDHYILGWSFNKSGPAQSLDISNLPQVPRQGKRKRKLGLSIMTLLVATAVVLITITGAGCILRRKKYEEVREDWEGNYGPHRFSYKDLYKATRGFKNVELLGAGGFGKVYKGILPSSGIPVAVKRVSHDSKQGMKKFVAEIISMARLRC